MASQAKANAASNFARHRQLPARARVPKVSQFRQAVHRSTANRAKGSVASNCGRLRQLLARPRAPKARQVRPERRRSTASRAKANAVSNFAERRPRRLQDTRHLRANRKSDSNAEMLAQRPVAERLRARI